MDLQEKKAKDYDGDGKIESGKDDIWVPETNIKKAIAMKEDWQKSTAKTVLMV